ncbi:hypothetical protein HELRODRAFT_91560 [Helobdella robusta]|uniref:RING-type domain-containing protein n=1 Tax=Helobdella robusta TaxID=6412 RepID=T1G854_HELRO|nr:hypothetical protein HELRODRAFT_91560 [Helobdella robusta]ESO11268.1 hypothetical protein HELRODRAFT_91560 [Helobdella robusta]
MFHFKSFILLPLSSHTTPNSLQLIQQFADNETSWMLVMEDLVYVIPPEQPLAPVAVSVIVEECCVPSKELITKLSETLNVNDQGRVPPNVKMNRKMNICILLACLAEKMAGPLSVILLSEMILSFLFRCIKDQSDPSLTLFALIALEKFTLTGENKCTILDRLKEDNILSGLECHHDNELDFRLRQIGFCVRWSLDNLCDNEQNNADAAATTTSPTAVATSPTTATVATSLATTPTAAITATATSPTTATTAVATSPARTSIPTATAPTINVILNHDDGYGIGDDETSIAYDGCRQLIWYKAKSTKHTQPCWKPGDILGLLLNVDSKEVIFSLNGDCLPPNKLLFTLDTPGGYYAAASFMSYQQCIFNFGASPFVYPPKIAYKKLNDYGMLTLQQRTILPRHMKMSYLKHISISEDSCTICVDHQACIKLEPCAHTGFCEICAEVLENCPLCRQKIEDRVRSDVIKGDGDAVSRDHL